MRKRTGSVRRKPIAWTNAVSFSVGNKLQCNLDQAIISFNQQRATVTQPLPEPMLTYRQLKPKGMTYSNGNATIFIQEGAFENVVCTKTAILFRPQFIDIPTDNDIRSILCANGIFVKQHGGITFTHHRKCKFHCSQDIWDQHLIQIVLMVKSMENMMKSIYISKCMYSTTKPRWYHVWDIFTYHIQLLYN